MEIVMCLASVIMLYLSWIRVGYHCLRCQYVSDEMIFSAAKALAGEVTDSELEQGRIFPSLTKIRSVSMVIAAALRR